VALAYKVTIFASINGLQFLTTICIYAHSPQQEHTLHAHTPAHTGEQWVSDVSIIHPGAATSRAAAAQTDGSAAARRDVEKTSQYRGYGAGCYHFVPLKVERPMAAWGNPS
jgi:hypothetical protein